MKKLKIDPLIEMMRRERAMLRSMYENYMEAANWIKARIRMIDKVNEKEIQGCRRHDKDVKGDGE